MSTTLYIAGPMTGLPDFNYPAFNAAEKALRTAGYGVYNPVRSSTGFMIPRLEPKDWTDYMRNGLNQLIRADGIALLPDWENSKGARIEARLAYDLGLRVAHLETWVLAGTEGPDPTELLLIDLEPTA